MTNLRINLPEELDGKEPWLYIDSNMSLEVHEEILIDLFKIVIQELDPTRIIISFTALPDEIELISKIFEHFQLNNNDVFLEVEKTDFIKTLGQLFKVIKVQEKSSLLIELDSVNIVGGGAGCLGIWGKISIQQYNQIVINFLKELNIDVQANLTNLKNYQLILLNSNSSLIELFEN